MTSLIEMLACWFTEVFAVDVAAVIGKALAEFPGSFTNIYP